MDDELLETARVYEEKVKDKDEDILMVLVARVACE